VRSVNEFNFLSIAKTIEVIIMAVDRSHSSYYSSHPSVYYQSILETSERIGWHIEDIIGAEKPLDFFKPFLPEALVSVDAIQCLNRYEKLKLNQIRGNSYLHLFSLCEEFILPTVVDYVSRIRGEDVYATLAFLNFAKEESKHIQLFRQFSVEFERGFGSRCEVIEPVQTICAEILNHHPLAVALLTLHIEWMTQRHYLESVRGNQGLDPQFCSLLRYHWLEEAQHAKLDTLMIQRLVAEQKVQELEIAIDDYFKIISLLSRLFKQQVKLDFKSFSRVTDRCFTSSEKQEIRSVQEKSYQWTFLWAGMTHQNVVRMFGDISPIAQARLLNASTCFEYS
jgi:hypothetical protein